MYLRFVFLSLLCSLAPFPQEGGLKGSADESEPGISASEFSLSGSATKVGSLPLAVQIRRQDLKVGRAAVKITPPKGMPMQGYYHVRLSEGTHDDLYAKA
ncbi:MAG: hypothetical protein J2P41_09055, partial [Blastocatellia bacterium]|nr:hypothetical protein [Blastocatellia bacterium]